MILNVCALSGDVFARGRDIALAWLRALPLLAALLSPGILPAVAASGSNEAESSALESTLAQDAVMHCTGHSRDKRLASPHYGDCVVAAPLLPASARREAAAAILFSSASRTSLGLAVPLRL